MKIQKGLFYNQPKDWSKVLFNKNIDACFFATYLWHIINMVIFSNDLNNLTIVESYPPSAQNIKHYCRFF